jgi:hypothetical protein
VKKDDHKIEALRKLEKAGVVRELCPHEDGWHFHVVKPAELPEEFKAEYKRSGEIKW